MSDIDAFVREQVTPTLRDGEQIQSIAYLKSAPGGGIVGAIKSKAWFGALTEQRLILIKTRVGAFKPLLENQGMESVERSDIQGVYAGGKNLSIALANQKPLLFRRDKTAKKIESQSALIDELSKSYGGSPSAKKLKNKHTLKMALTGLAVAGFIGFGIYQGYSSRVKVRVQCNPTRTNLECTAQHTQGKKKVKACWSVVFKCANGERPQKRACVDVVHGSVAKKVLPISEFSNFDRCDKITSADVTNLKLD